MSKSDIRIDRGTLPDIIKKQFFLALGLTNTNQIARLCREVGINGKAIRAVLGEYDATPKVTTIEKVARLCGLGMQVTLFNKNLTDKQLKREIKQMKQEHEDGKGATQY